jgi:hypothetical protein|nr:hypothetical protein [Bacteroides intestinalis]
MKNPPAELDSLKKEIEDKFNIYPETKNDYITLAFQINKKLKDLGQRGSTNAPESISEESIYKVWGYRKNNDAIISVKVLGILARSIGYASWNKYVEDCKKNEVSKSFTPELIDRVSKFFRPELINVSQIRVDEEVTVGWPPYKYAILKCKDDYEFEIIEANNTKNEVGFIFLTTGFHISPIKKENSFPDIIFEPYYDDIEGENWTLKDLTTIPEKYYL